MRPRESLWLLPFDRLRAPVAGSCLIFRRLAYWLVLFIPQFVMSCVTFGEPGSVMQLAVQAPFPGEPQGSCSCFVLPTLHAASVSHPSVFFYYYYYYYY